MLAELYNREGNQIGDLEIRDDIFGIEPNEHAMHQSVVVYLANGRQGTHKAKVRDEVSGGGKKPWRQKGRGTARAGSTRSPLWVGGGTIHGPKPHKYTLKITKQLKRLARKSALSLRLSEQNIIFVDDFNLDEAKTKYFAEFLKNIKIYGEKTLVLMPDYKESLYLSARNINNLSILPADKISTYDILSHKKLVIFKSALDTIYNTFNN